MNIDHTNQLYFFRVGKKGGREEEREGEGEEREKRINIIVGSVADCREHATCHDQYSCNNRH